MRTHTNSMTSREQSRSVAMMFVHCNRVCWLPKSFCQYRAYTKEISYYKYHHLFCTNYEDTSTSAHARYFIGDEVYSYPHHLFANVNEVFPAAVCVKIGILSINGYLEMIQSPQLWRADDIENLSVCRYCGNREDLEVEHGTGIPFRTCKRCREESLICKAYGSDAE